MRVKEERVWAACVQRNGVALPYDCGGVGQAVANRPPRRSPESSVIALALERRALPGTDRPSSAGGRKLVGEGELSSTDRIEAE